MRQDAAEFVLCVAFGCAVAAPVFLALAFALALALVFGDKENSFMLANFLFLSPEYEVCYQSPWLFLGTHQELGKLDQAKNVVFSVREVNASDKELLSLPEPLRQKITQVMADHEGEHFFPLNTSSAEECLERALLLLQQGFLDSVNPITGIMMAAEDCKYLTSLIKTRTGPFDPTTFITPQSLPLTNCYCLVFNHLNEVVQSPDPDGRISGGNGIDTTLRHFFPRREDFSFLRLAQPEMDAIIAQYSDTKVDFVRPEECSSVYGCYLKAFPGLIFNELYDQTVFIQLVKNKRVLALRDDRGIIIGAVVFTLRSVNLHVDSLFRCDGIACTKTPRHSVGERLVAISAAHALELGQKAVTLYYNHRRYKVGALYHRCGFISQPKFNCSYYLKSSYCFDR